MNSEPNGVLVNFISCRWKTACGIKCSCKIAERWYTVVCMHFDLDICENVPEVSLNIEEDEYDDQEAILRRAVSIRRNEIGETKICDHYSHS